jgi:hypothetical protein
MEEAVSHQPSAFSFLFDERDARFYANRFAI